MTTTDTETGDDTIADDIKQGIGVLATLVSAFVPGAQVGGFAVSELASLAEAVVDAEPAAVAAYNDIKTTIEGGAPPTPAQIAALKAAIDADDDALQTEVQQLDAAAKEDGA